MNAMCTGSPCMKLNTNMTCIRHLQTDTFSSTSTSTACQHTHMCVCHFLSKHHLTHTHTCTWKRTQNMHTWAAGVFPSLSPSDIKLQHTSHTSIRFSLPSATGFSSASFFACRHRVVRSIKQSWEPSNSHENHQTVVRTIKQSWEPSNSSNKPKSSGFSSESFFICRHRKILHTY